jgi:putative SOS response-associated peptidase YedK
VVGAIHPKAVPVIVDDDDHERWLTAPVKDALGLAVPFPSQLMALSG